MIRLILSWTLFFFLGLLSFEASYANDKNLSFQNQQEYTTNDATHVIYFDKASFFLGQKDYNKTVQYAKLAIQEIEQHKPTDSLSRDIHEKALEVLSQVYDIQRKTKESYTTKKCLMNVKDSLTRERYKSSIQAIDHEHQLAQIQAKQLTLQAENEAKNATIKKRTYSIILISTILALVVATIFMVLQSSQIRTRKKRMLQTKLDKRTQELNEMHQKLQVANRELEELAYISSRDLKTPLKRIRVLMNKIEQEKENMSLDAQSYLPFITEGSKRLERLIDNLFSFSKLNGNTLPTEECNLNLLIEESLTHISRLYQEKNASIKYDNLPTIYSNHHQLGVILKNLIENGIKYNNRTKPEIHIQYQPNPQYHLIQVKDNGIGIAPEHIEDVFKMFKRLHSQEEYEGTGLGLAICQKIAHSLGGEITLESTPNVGSTFILQLPKIQQTL